MADTPEELDALATRYHDFTMRSNPTLAHLIGDYRFAGKFEDTSRAAEDDEIAERRAIAAAAEAIDPVGLSAQDRITREMLVIIPTSEADLQATRLDEFAVDPIFGLQASLPVRIPKLPLTNEEVSAALPDKFRGIAANFRDRTERLREGVANGRTPARFAVTDTVAQLDAWLAGPVESDPLLETGEPHGITDTDAWRRELRAIVENDIRPAMAAQRDVIRDVVGPVARPDEHAGLVYLPDGVETYETAIRYYTTTEKTAQEIHDIGLRQIELLKEEYRTIGKEALGLDDVAEVQAAMRDSAKMHDMDGPTIVANSKTALAKAKAAMGDWFGILPKADCDVEETKSGAVAFYFPPARDGSRGGVFFMNTSDPSGWGRHEIEATAYHEGIPGHHLQLAISSELENVPTFRKLAFIAAYGEGWGLYTERLADEMGLYSSPIDRLGMLQADSMRACRLVVDTGMHALGWSRQKALDYMLANSPMRAGHVAAEIDRYAVTPGQALAYMIGRLEIQRIRGDAEKALGERFDIKAFHDTVLGSGLMPLSTLDRHVADWVAEQRT
jgi:uncharacterized protein (DUF885 family)